MSTRALLATPVIALYAAWVLPLLPWVGRSLGDEDGLWRAAVVGLGLALALSLSRKDPPLPGRASALPLLFAIGPALLAPLFPSLETVQVLLAVLTGYGLLGLWLPPERWQALGPLAALIALCVPASVWLDVALGWPLRKAIASVAASVLGGVPLETVIRVEGGVAHVDLPCAGVRSLWSLGAMMLLWALARGRGLDLRWAAAALLAALVALAANTGRVVILVGLAHVWRVPQLAETVHVPLGAVGFAAALALGVALGELLERGARPRPLRGTAPAQAWRLLPVAAALAVALWGQVPSQGPQEITAAAPVPSGWSEIEPTAIERSFAQEHGASVTKAMGPAGASVVLVASRSWLAHHVPEQCLLAHGWRLDEDHPTWLGGVPVRQAAVRRDGQRATAIWWFQRGEEVTDDLVVRIRGGGRWVLVSVLVPGEAPPEELAGFLNSVRQAAAAEET
jgi:exosortase O